MITIEPPNRTISRARVAGFLARARKLVALGGEVHLLLADDAALRRLNKLFRGVDKTTDVLSFPAAENGTGVAGDLAISLDAAQRQAAEFGHSLQDEVHVLMLHGLLHLAGFDHETDKGEMAAKELVLRRKLALPVGLIERAKPVPAKKPPLAVAASAAPKKRILKK
jgi:probable rRNA maturation factor